jgi:anti-sigma factor RsiW
MADADLPTYLTRGIALTRAQLQTSLGTGLLSLCRSVTADGRLAPEELTALRQWLDDAEAADMPALGHLRRVIERVLADGRITPEEYQEVHRAVESVLPFEDRQRAVAARLQVEASEQVARAPAGLRTRVAWLAVALALAGAAVAWLAGGGRLG